MLYRLGKKRLQEIVKYLKWGWILVPLLFIFITYFQRIYKQLVSERVMYYWWVFLLGGMLLSVGFLAYLAIQKEKERYWLLQQKDEMLENDYRAIQKTYQEREVLLHDVKKHMMVIQDLAMSGKGQEIVHYLEEMDSALQKGRNHDFVNHNMLNLVLNNKFSEAENSGISVHYELEDLGSLILKPTEVCALFSNILDNAIEANQSLDEKRDRWIKLACSRNGKMLFLFISNPMKEEKIIFVGGLPQTTKKDRGRHGVGMKSIRQVVDAYSGNMQIEARGGIFKLKVCVEAF